MARSAALIVATLSITAFAAQPDSDWSWNLPKGFPIPPVPADNPMTAAKVELGRYLFYDTRMSVNGKQSCATCHQQNLAFTDGRAVAVGTTGENHPRSAMSLVNIAYAGAVRRFGVAVATIGAEYTALAVGITYSLFVREPWSWLTVVAGALLVAALGVTFAARKR